MSFKLFDSISPESRGALVQAWIYIKEPRFHEKMQEVMSDMLLYGSATYRIDCNGEITNISYKQQLVGESYGKSPMETFRSGLPTGLFKEHTNRFIKHVIGDGQ